MFWGNWALDAIETSEVAEAAEVNEAGEVSTACKITTVDFRVFQVLVFNLQCGQSFLQPKDAVLSLNSPMQSIWLWLGLKISKQSNIQLKLILD